MLAHNLQPQLTEGRVNALVMLWLDSMRSQDKWDLTQEEVCTLLGCVSPKTYRSWISKARCDDEIALTIDVDTRLSLLTGIKKALAMSAPEGFEYDFFKRSINHPLFNGKSVKESIISNPSILNLDAIRKYFDARRA